jgi:hypothetical protein
MPQCNLLQHMMEEEEVEEEEVSLSISLWGKIRDKLQ